MNSDELRTAIGNCTTVETMRGFRLSKIIGSRKIDLAAALSFATLAVLREGRTVEPGLLTYYREMAQRARRADGQAQRQTSTLALVGTDYESGEELIANYENTLRELRGSGGRRW
jgi:hypothetical protein